MENVGRGWRVPLNLCHYVPGTQMTRVFDWKGPSLGRFNFQNRGQTGSRYLKHKGYIGQKR